MKIRKVEAKDRAVFLELADQFWHTPAVHQPIERSHHEKTFDLLMEGTPFAAAHLIEYQGKVVGYGLLAFTYSNEAGGNAVWLEELFVRPEFQGMGLGRDYILFVHEEYGDWAARFRLEIDSRNKGAAKLYERHGYRKMPYLELYRDGKNTSQPD